MKSKDAQHQSHLVRPAVAKRAVALLLFLLWVAVPGADAAVWHACDCAAGADADCVAGDDANPGSPASPWRSAAAVRARFLSMAAGDQVRLCRGGAFESHGLGNWYNTRCRADQPCVLGDYLAPFSSGDEGRPILRMLSDVSAIALANGGDALQDGGYLVEGLHLIGAGDQGNGVFLFNDVDDVELRDLEIQGFGIGVHQAGSNPCRADQPCDGRNQRIVLRASSIHHNSGQGWLGGDSGTQILDNHFESNGTRPVFDHNIYLSAPMGVGVNVLRNTLYRSALDPQGACQGTSLVVHGRFRDLRIEHNLVREDPGAAGQGCWGIAVTPGYASAERFENVTISGNRVHDVGNVLIGLSACINCRVENNLLTSSQPFEVRAIIAPACCGGAGDALMQALDVHNNSIHLASHGGSAITIGNEGGLHRVSHNAIELSGNSGFSCFSIAAPAVLAWFDRHRCGGSQPGLPWVAQVGALGTWATQTGFDQQSAAVLPGFANGFQRDLRAASAQSAMVDAGDPAYAAGVDIDGLPRDQSPDIGAHEWRQNLLMRDGFEQSGPLPGSRRPAR